MLQDKEGTADADLSRANPHRSARTKIQIRQKNPRRGSADKNFTELSEVIFFEQQQYGDFTI